jgi:ornithine cyclodeaminase
MLTPVLIAASEVHELLPPADCVAVMDRAMRAISTGQFDAPARLVSPVGDGHFFTMPGSMTGGPVFGAKLVSLLPGNPENGLPAVQGLVVLFDQLTGSPLALVDGAAVTCLRTAAASALATRELAREDSASHGVFGAGALAEQHIRSIATVRDIKKTLVWARNPARARAFAARMSAETGMPVESAGHENAAACDVVTLVTNSPKPILEGRWLAPGCHINLVGAHRPEHREADSDTVAGAAVYVDSLDGALEEAGDILIPIAEGRIGESTIVGEIGQVLEGDVPGRQDAMQRTLYKSLGHVAQDLFAADFIFRQSWENRAG